MKVWKVVGIIAQCLLALFCAFVGVLFCYLLPQIILNYAWFILAILVSPVPMLIFKKAGITVNKKVYAAVIVVVLIVVVVDYYIVNSIPFFDQSEPEWR